MQENTNTSTVAPYKPGDRFSRDPIVLKITRVCNDGDYMVESGTQSATGVVVFDGELTKLSHPEIEKFVAGKPMKDLPPDPEPEPPENDPKSGDTVTGVTVSPQNPSDASPHSDGGTEGGLAADIDADIATRPTPPEPPDDGPFTLDDLRAASETLYMASMPDDPTVWFDPETAGVRIKPYMASAPDEMAKRDATIEILKKRIERLEAQLADAANAKVGRVDRKPVVAAVEHKIEKDIDEIELNQLVADGWHIETLQFVPVGDGAITCAHLTRRVEKTIPAPSVTASIGASLVPVDLTSPRIVQDLQNMTPGELVAMTAGMPASYRAQLLDAQLKYRALAHLQEIAS